MRTLATLAAVLAVGTACATAGAGDAEAADPLEPPDSDWTLADDRPCLVWRHFPPALSESYTWSGACVDGKASGEGVLTYAWDQVLNRGTEYVYEGGMKAGKRHGHGTMVSPSTTYEGEWRDGRQNGYGTLTWRHSRTRYEGEWHNGTRHGYGILTWSDGRRYEGEWCLDYRHGHGTKILERGLAVTCTWYANGAVSDSCTVHLAPPPSADAPAQRTDFHKETCSYEQVIAPLLR